MNDDFIISLHKNKQSVYIILYNSYTTLDCNTIHNTILESLQDDEIYSDINLQDLYGYEIYVFLDSILLNGSKEIESNPLYFGKLDSKGLDSKGEFIESNDLNSNSNMEVMELDETKPIYYLESNDEFSLDSNNTESNSIDSSIATNNQSNNNKTNSKSLSNTESKSKDSNTYQNNTDSSHTNANRVGSSTLKVFLNDSTLTILNYSLLDSSLNIKLECTSKESKEILEKERKIKEKLESRAKDSIALQNIESFAMLSPVLEDNEIKCPHNGVVKLKSSKGKSFKSKGISMILEFYLLNSQIIGCTNNILGVPTPCTLVSTILPTARALKKYNDDYPIMQDLVSGNIFTDKGFQLCHT